MSTTTRAATTEAGTLFRQGKLSQAVAAAEAGVRAAPANVATRLLLAELLLFSGQFERADSILVAADAVEPGLAVVVAEFRQLLRAAGARRQAFTEGRLPEFLGAPTRAQTALLAALVALRGGNLDAAAAAANDAETFRPPAAGKAGGVPFADFRDADDLLGGTLEVLTTTGKYYWIPVERGVTLRLHEPKRPRDLVWRRCTMSVRDGPDGEVYIPVLYTPTLHADAAAGPEDGGDDPLCLGRRTEWTTAAPVRGRGQRVFLVGDDGVPIDRLRDVAFA